jgi:hypothetical protein
VTLDAVDLATIAEAVAVCIAAAFAAVQLLQARRTRQLELLVTLFAEFHESTNYLRRQRVLLLATDTWGPDSVHEDEVRHTCDFFQRIGFLVRNRGIPEKLVLEMYSGAIVSCFDATRSYVQHVRAEYGIANYGVDFEWIADRARRYRLRQYGEVGDFSRTPSQRSEPVSSRTPGIVVAIPYFNEGHHIPGLIADIELMSEFTDQILVIDDGSRASDANLLEELDGVQIVRHRLRSGYGSTVKTAAIRAAASGAGYVAIFPGDRQRSVSDLEVLILSAVEATADLVIGRKQYSRSDRPLVRYLTGVGALFVGRHLLGIACDDPASGFKVYRVAKLMEVVHLLPDDFSFDLAVGVCATQLQWSVTEVETDVRWDSSRSSIRHPLAVGFVALYECLRLRRRLVASRG